MKDDLSRLVERARDAALPIREQHSAFAEIVTRFEESAILWAIRLLDDPEEARDATQDAFIAAWLKLRTLRDAAAFAPWLKRLVATQCSRRRRKRREERLCHPERSEGSGRQGGTQLVPPATQIPRYARNDTQATSAHQLELDRRDRQRVVAKAMTRLSDTEHRVVVLFYFLGRTMAEIGAILGIPAGTVGKRLHSARIAIRRRLPPEVRGDFRPPRPSRSFLQRVREGVFDEYTGDYRFEKRRNHIVHVRREGSLLVGYGGGQRNILASIGDDALIATEFDGEGRFERDRSGRIARFVYYEFGARLGVAKRVEPRRRSRR